MITHPFNDYHIKIITPVHIGNDTQINPLMFHHAGDYVYTYALDDVAKSIENPKKLLDIKHSRVTLKSVIGEALLKQLKPLKTIHYWGDEKDVSHQEMELLVSENHENFLPGSSIKGSILHAIEFKNFELLMKGDKSAFFDIINRFSKSFAVPDLYFNELETAIQRGMRVTTANKHNKKNNQKQDNYKEWFMLGTTKHFNAYFRNEETAYVLKAIHDFTARFLTYQRSYYQYILDQMNLTNYPLSFDEVQGIIKQVERLIAINKEDEPLLILGRNTHRYSKSNELYFNDYYKKTPGKNKKHPVSRLLVYDAVDSLTIPGMVHIKKR